MKIDMMCQLGTRHFSTDSVENCQEAFATEVLQIILQQLKPADNVKHAKFCTEMMEKIAIEDDFLSNIAFRDEGTFHLSETVKHHNVQIWGWKTLTR